MDDIWVILLSLLSAAAGYFARVFVESVRRAIEAVWNESKTRRRHREALETLREEHSHIEGLREIDLQSEIVKRGTSRGGYDAGVRNP